MRLSAWGGVALLSGFAAASLPTIEIKASDFPTQEELTY